MLKFYFKGYDKEFDELLGWCRQMRIPVIEVFCYSLGGNEYVGTNKHGFSSKRSDSRMPHLHWMRTRTEDDLTLLHIRYGDSVTVE